MEEMKVLVVYYTRKGTTKKVAELISHKLKCECEEIIDKKERKKFIIGFLTSGRDATREFLADIKNIQHNPNLYDLIILGTPIWNKRMTPAIRAYISENKTKFNNLCFFCTHLKRIGMGITFEQMAKLSEVTPILNLEITKYDIKKGYHLEKIDKFVLELNTKKLSERRLK